MDQKSRPPINVDITTPPTASSSAAAKNGSSLAKRRSATDSARIHSSGWEQDGEGGFNGTGAEKPVSAFRSILPQILAVNVKNVLLFGYGMTLGFPTILIPAILGGEGRESTIDNKLQLSKEEISWLSSINLICVPLGCIFSGSLAQPLGRRRAMQFVNVPILAAWLCFYFSTEVTHLYAGLCLAGLSGGLSEAPVLTYVAEVTTPRVRGLLAASGSFCAILGVFVQFILGTFLKWRLIALISVAVPIISFTLLFFVPESPHWLIQKNRLPEAMESLAWLRGWVPVSHIRAEYEVIYANVTKSFGARDPSCSGRMQPYKRRSFLWPYTIISICFFVGHFSGMTTLQTYAVQIFHTLKAPIDKYYATMLLGLAELLGTLLCILLVHHTGKRRIVLASTIGCGLCFLGTATYAYFLNEIPGSSISNVVANSSEILAHPLPDVVLLNATNFETMNGDDDDEDNALDITTTTNPFEYASFYRNDTYELIALDSMMDFRVANEQETNDSEEVAAPTTTLLPLLLLGDGREEAANKVHSNDSQVEAPGEANLPESFLLPVTKHAENKFLWVPLTLLLGSAMLSHCGIRLIPWMLIGEIYPTAVRGGAAGLSGGTGYIFGFLSNKLFLKLLATLTLPGTFWMYSSVSLVGAVVLYFILPETEGRSLVDIEEHFTGGRTLKETLLAGRAEKEEAIKNIAASGRVREYGAAGRWRAEEEDGDLKGNFRRSSCEVSNAANRQICPPPTITASTLMADANKEAPSASQDEAAAADVVIVVPDKPLEPSESIGNTLPPITNPLEVQNVGPRIYVEFCDSNRASSEDEDADGIQAVADTGNSSGGGVSRGNDPRDKFNGSESQKAQQSRNDKLFEEAVRAHGGSEWLQRIKDARGQNAEQRRRAMNAGMGMRRKRVL